MSELTGFSFISKDAQGDTAKQVADVEDLVARRVSAIFLAPRDFEGSRSCPRHRA